MGLHCDAFHFSTITGIFTHLVLVLLWLMLNAMGTICIKRICKSCALVEGQKVNSEWCGVHLPHFNVSKLI